MSQTVWIARHGNRLDFVHPEWFSTAAKRYDPPLSEDGLVQATELAQRLKIENISHIFASPFLRTIQTANEVAKVLQLPIKLECGLGEWHNAEWMTEKPEIQTKAWLTRKYPLIDWNYESYLIPTYPESKTDVYQRTKATITNLVSNFDQNILVVGHGASVFGVTKGLIPQVPEFRVALCCLTKIVRTQADNWHLDFYGDTTHLSKTESQIRLN